MSHLFCYWGHPAVGISDGFEAGLPLIITVILNYFLLSIPFLEFFPYLFPNLPLVLLLWDLTDIYSHLGCKIWPTGGWRMVQKLKFLLLTSLLHYFFTTSCWTWLWTTLFLVKVASNPKFLGVFYFFLKGKYFSPYGPWWGGYSFQKLAIWGRNYWWRHQKMFPKFFATPKTLHNFINFHKFFIQTGSIRMKFNFGQKHLICHFPIQKSQLLHHPSAPNGPNFTTKVRIYISKIP